MRNLLTVIVCCVLVSSAKGQCSERFVENLRGPEGQRLTTYPQILVVRGSYAYSVSFSASHKGIRADLTSRGGEKPNQGDELLIITKGGERRVFQFVSKLRETSLGGVPVYSNELQLDLPTAQWMAADDIEVLTLINNSNNQGRRFTLQASRQAELRQLIQCFVVTIDPAAIPNIAAVTTAIPAVARKPQPLADNGNGLSAKPATTSVARKDEANQNASSQEVVDLRDQLTKLKQQLLEEIAIEKAKSERAKALLAAEVEDAKQAADIQRQAIAAEVVASRQRATQAVVEANTTASAQVAVYASTVQHEATEAAQAVQAARQRALLAIETSRTQAAEEIARIRADNAAAVGAEQVKLLQAQRTYTSEVQTAQQRSQAEVIGIRKRLEAQLAEVRREAIAAVDSTQATVASTRLEARKQVLAAREQSLQRMAEFEEAGVREREKRALEFAELKRHHAEVLAVQQASFDKLTADLSEDLVNQRSAFAQELDKARASSGAERSALADSVTQSRSLAASKIAAAQQAEVTKIAQAELEGRARREVLTQEVRSTQAAAATHIAAIQEAEALAIKASREAAAARRTELEQELSAFQRELAERRSANAAALEIQLAKISARQREQEAIAQRREYDLTADYTAQREAMSADLEVRKLEIEKELAQNRQRLELKSDSLANAHAARVLALAARERALPASPTELPTERAGIERQKESLEAEGKQLQQTRARSAEEFAAMELERKRDNDHRATLLRKSLSYRDSLAAEAGATQAKYRKQVASLEEELARRSNQLQDQAIAEQEALLRDLSDVRREHSAALAAEGEKVARELSTLQQNQAESIAKQRQVYDLERKRLDTEHTGYKQGLAAERQSSRDELDRELAAERRRIETEKTALAESLAAEEARVGASLNETRLQLAQEVARERKRADQEIADTRAQAAKTMTETQQAYDKKTLEIGAAQELALARLSATAAKVAGLEAEREKLDNAIVRLREAIALEESKLPKPNKEK